MDFLFERGGGTNVDCRSPKPLRLLFKYSKRRAGNKHLRSFAMDLIIRCACSFHRDVLVVHRHVVLSLRPLVSIAQAAIRVKPRLGKHFRSGEQSDRLSKLHYGVSTYNCSAIKHPSRRQNPTRLVSNDPRRRRWLQEEHQLPH